MNRTTKGGIILAKAGDLAAEELRRKVKGAAPPRAAPPPGMTEARLPMAVVRECMAWGGFNALTIVEDRFGKVEEALEDYKKAKADGANRATRKKALRDALKIFETVLGECRAAKRNLRPPPRDVVKALLASGRPSAPPPATKPGDGEIRPLPTEETETREDKPAKVVPLKIPASDPEEEAKKA